MTNFSAGLISNRCDEGGRNPKENVIVDISLGSV
jgi:hypothetical protein